MEEDKDISPGRHSRSTEPHRAGQNHDHESSNSKMIVTIMDRGKIQRKTYLGLNGFPRIYYCPVLSLFDDDVIDRAKELKEVS
ncbi:MAG TPA: hypothetical protein VMT62_12955 [Syntrophorhabdaceae bacterium]|nr:hypothetical protein [Syntrophorhabdaceae bacterium]